MDTILTNPQMVVEDRQRHLFRVARRACLTVRDGAHINLHRPCEPDPTFVTSPVPEELCDLPRGRA